MTVQNNLRYSALNLRYRGTNARIAELETQLAALRHQHIAAIARISELETQVVSYRDRQAMTDKRLDILLAVGGALLVTHETDEIVDLIVHEAIALFPNATAALLFLADPTNDTLLLRADSRAASDDTHPLLTLRLAHEAFAAPKALYLTYTELYDSPDHLPVDISTTLPELHHTWPPHTALLAPLRTETQQIGALVLYTTMYESPFLPCDVPFLQALADLTVIAINEAYQRAQTAALQRDLVQTQSLHQQAQAQLDTAQAQLLQSAKLAAVGELAASVAHEINNPLYAARNSLYLVEQDLPPDAPQRPFLDIAQQELGRIAGIITRMRDFYRPARAELAETNVNTLLNETIELVQNHLCHNFVTLHTDFDESLPHIIAHADQLRQVFLNLILNACDAMADGGTLKIATSSPDHDSITVNITDSGIGIAPEHIPFLFEPFYTTKPHGTGLGLAISAHIVTQYGGQITVQSSPGHETTFCIALPIHARS